MGIFNDIFPDSQQNQQPIINNASKILIENRTYRRSKTLSDILKSSLQRFFGRFASRIYYTRNKRQTQTEEGGKYNGMILVKVLHDNT